MKNKVIRLLLLMLIMTSAFAMPMESLAEEDIKYYEQSGSFMGKWITVNLGPISLYQEGQYVYLTLDLSNNAWGPGRESLVDHSYYETIDPIAKSNGAKKLIRDRSKDFRKTGWRSGGNTYYHKQVFAYRLNMNNLPAENEWITFEEKIGYYVSQWNAPHNWSGGYKTTNTKTVSIRIDYDQIPTKQVTEHYWEVGTGEVLSPDTVTTVFEDANYTKEAPDNIPHYRYVGYNTTGSTRVRDTDNQAVIRNITSDREIWFLYEKQDYTVDYDANAEYATTNVVDAKSPYKALSNVTILPANSDEFETVRRGFNLKGWTMNREGKGTLYQEDDVFRIEKNTTLYAQWEKKPDLEVTKTADRKTVLPSGDIQYTITLRNNTDLFEGETPRDFNDITLTDSMGNISLGNPVKDLAGQQDIQVDWMSNVAHIQCLKPGQSVTFRYTYKAPYDAPKGHLIQNTATAETGDYKVEDSATVKVDRTLMIEKWSNFSVAEPGQVIKYYIKVTNLTDEVYKGVQVSDNLQGAVLQTHTPGVRIVSGGRGAVIPTLQPNESVLFFYDYQVDDKAQMGETIDNIATTKDPKTRYEYMDKNRVVVNVWANIQKQAYVYTGDDPDYSLEKGWPEADMKEVDHIGLNETMYYKVTAVNNSPSEDLTFVMISDVLWPNDPNKWEELHFYDRVDENDVPIYNWTVLEGGEFVQWQGASTQLALKEDLPPGGRVTFAYEYFVDPTETFFRDGTLKHYAGQIIENRVQFFAMVNLKQWNEDTEEMETLPHEIGKGSDGTLDDWCFVRIGDAAADTPASVVNAPDINGFVGKPIEPVTVTQEGGTVGGTWTITGLPRGLVYDEYTGVISGTPLDVVKDLPYTAVYTTPNDGRTTSGNGKSNITDVELKGPEPNFGEDYIIKILRIGDTGEPGLTYTGTSMWQKNLPGLWYKAGETRTPLTPAQIRALRVYYDPYELQPDGSYGYSGQTTAVCVADVDVASGEVKLTGLKSGLARVTLSDGKSSYSFLVIVPGDVDLNGELQEADETRVKERRRIPLKDYPYQHMLADMDNDAVAEFEASAIVINSNDIIIIEKMNNGALSPSN